MLWWCTPQTIKGMYDYFISGCSYLTTRVAMMSILSPLMPVTTKLASLQLPWYNVQNVMQISCVQWPPQTITVTNNPELSWCQVFHHWGQWRQRWYHPNSRALVVRCPLQTIREHTWLYWRYVKYNIHPKPLEGIHGYIEGMSSTISAPHH